MLIMTDKEIFSLTDFHLTILPAYGIHAGIFAEKEDALHKLVAVRNFAFDRVEMVGVGDTITLLVSDQQSCMEFLALIGHRLSHTGPILNISLLLQGERSGWLEPLAILAKERGEGVAPAEFFAWAKRLDATNCVEVNVNDGTTNITYEGGEFVVKSLFSGVTFYEGDSWEKARSAFESPEQFEEA